ncbi:GlcG/HbpS family heme-binding protein [Comamonas odontotermitis]|uniref:GlcG/HbpS family heme-binding protein n=1 Tax=Comamonas odontotermitis TaxID=379895 RepID=UPI001CC81FE6|nr:heme-binding protein [Comamonas odontotermitis]UBB18062.1 heme-binding protein [Comamonas odontotermitis]
MQRTLILAALSLAATAASAQGVRTEKNMSLELASQIAAQTVAACTASGYAVTATVVDRAGGVRAVQRADNAGPHTVEASRAKAFTSVSAKAPSLAIMENAQKNPAAANLKDIPGFLLLGGGVPVKVDSEVIGAVGVAGAPGGHLDDQCAQTALSKVADLLK